MRAGATWWGLTALLIALGAVLYYYNTQLSALQSTINQKQTRINELVEQYNNAMDEIKQANSVIQSQQRTIGDQRETAQEYQQDLNEYRVRLAQSTRPASPDMCPVQIDANAVRTANSNEDVKPDIYKAVRNLYIGNIARSTIIEFWPNPQSALVEINWSKFTSYVVISWTDDNQAIQAIYEVSYACYLYSGERDW